MEKIEQIEIMRNGRAVISRLRWLENRLWYIGEFNRSELIKNYSICPQQASSDIQLYKDLSKNNMTYDYKSKAYKLSDAFKPCFPKSPVEWLRNNSQDDKAIDSMQIEEVEGIIQSIDANIFRAINRARKKRLPIKIKYANFRKNSVHHRIISPHHIVSTDIRWHLRAWDHDQSIFVDIPISRILSAEHAPEWSWVPIEADISWHKKLPIILQARENLSELQREMVARNYAMQKGRAVIWERECLVYYRLASMQLLEAVRRYNGIAIEPNLHIVVSNFKDLLPLVIDIPEQQESDFILDLPWLRYALELKCDSKMSPSLLEANYIDWIGTGLSKIAAAYGADLTRSFLGKPARFLTPLSYAHEPPLGTYPVLVTLGGKCSDAIESARYMSQKCGSGALLTANYNSDCASVFQRINKFKLSWFIGRFPEKDYRFVNCRSILTMAAYVQQFILNIMNYTSQRTEIINIDYSRLADEGKESAKRVARTITRGSSWRSQQIVVVGANQLNSEVLMWTSILSESGIMNIHYVDIKDYTHGDHIAAVYLRNQIFLILETPTIKHLTDIFKARFETLFPVEIISLPDHVSAQFWKGLFFLLELTHFLSVQLGYAGKRPPKHPVVDSWRDWGELLKN